MVLILDGNSEQVECAWRKIGLFEEKNPICDRSRSNQIPQTDQTSDIAPYLGKPQKKFFS